MLKFVLVAVQRTVKIRVLNDGEQQTFRDGSQTALSMESDLDPAANVNEFDSRQVIARETPLFFCVAL